MVLPTRLESRGYRIVRSMVEGKSRKQALQSAFAQRALQNLFMFRARLCLDCHFQDHGTNYTSVSNAVTPTEKM